MTTIAVVPTINALSETIYHAVAGDKQASGNTMGEALDALTPQLEDDNNAAVLIVMQKHGPDRFFTIQQQQRREEMMRQWREARDSNRELPTESQSELEQLVMAEVRAAGFRAAALLSDAAK